MTVGRRKSKRHPVVIFFLIMAMLSYWNAITPWLADLWNWRVYDPDVVDANNSEPLLFELKTLTRLIPYTTRFKWN